MWLWYFSTPFPDALKCADFALFDSKLLGQFLLRQAGSES